MKTEKDLQQRIRVLNNRLDIDGIKVARDLENEGKGAG